MKKKSKTHREKLAREATAKAKATKRASKLEIGESEDEGAGKKGDDEKDKTESKGE